MPQMSPLYWLLLYFFFIIIIIIMMTMFYFLKFKKMIKNLNLKTNMKSWNWKW